MGTKKDGGSPLDMSYANLNQIYSEPIKITVGEYTAFIGGVSTQWNALNEENSSGVAVIADSTQFANFQ